MSREVCRRRFLAALGAAGASAVAGCGGTEAAFATETAEPGSDATPTAVPDPVGTPSHTATPTATPDPTETPAPEASDVHPAWVDVADEPFLGLPLAETGATIVEFTDVSCPYCAFFSNRVFPNLKAELVDTGKVTYVSRDFPHVASWANPATRALEAVRDRDPDHYWPLKHHYYDNRTDISAGNLGSVVAEFLAETDVDGRAVVDEAYSDRWKATLRTDRRAVRDAKVRMTPTFFLFEDGEFVSRINGAQGLPVFRRALDL